MSARGEVAISLRTRPIRTALMAPGSLACWLLALSWAFVAPNYWVFTVTGAVPLAITALGLLVLQGWAREISLVSAGLYGTALYFFGYLERPDNLGKGIPWPFAALIAIGAVTALMVAMA